MKIDEIKKKPKDGTYVGVKLSSTTLRALANYCDANHIPNRQWSKKFHITLLYSTKTVDGIKTKNIPSGAVCTVEKLDTWTGHDGKTCLIMKLNSQYLIARHNEIIDTYDATHKYDEYNPHLTLSYDVGENFDVSSLPPFDGKIELAKEYVMDLIIGWQDD